MYALQLASGLANFEIVDLRRFLISCRNSDAATVCVCRSLLVNVLGKCLLILPVLFVLLFLGCFKRS